MKFFKTLAIAMLLSGMASCQPGREAARPPVNVSPEVEQLAAEVLASLADPVTLEITLGGEGESKAEETAALVEYIGRTFENVSVTRLGMAGHYEPAGLGTAHGPVIEMKGTAPGISRYYGYPERKEVRPFLEGILWASGLRPDLPPDTEAYVKALEKEVVIRIFTTPD